MNKEQLESLSVQLDDLEWRNRKLNLEIHGVPQTEGENLLSKLNALAGESGLPQLSEHDITAIHRLPAKRDKVPGIICRFARQSMRDKWWLAGGS